MILALDQSTERLGYCQMAPSGRISAAGASHAKGKLASDRIPLIIGQCKALFAEVPAGSIVALELTWSGRNPRTVDILAELRGRLIALAEAAHHQVRLVAPKAWQAWIGVHPRSKREVVKAAAITWAGRLLPTVVERNDSDMADAICIADYVRGQLQREGIARRMRRSA